MLHTVEFAFNYRSATPYWDFWNWLTDYQAYAAGHFTLHDLIKPHNEHRIVTTRLVLFVDAMFFHMTGRFVTFSILALLAVLGLILSRLSRQATGFPGFQMPAVVSMALTGSTCQWQNLVLPFQIQHAFLCVFVAASALLLVEAAGLNMPRGRAIAYAVAAGLSFLAAAFSMAGGLLALPCLAVLLILRRATWPVATIFLAIAATGTLLFLNGYHSTGPEHPLTALNLAVFRRLTEFTAGFLGNPFIAIGRGAFAAGALGIVLFAFASAMIGYRRFILQEELPEQVVALLAIAGSVVLMAGAAAVARLEVGLSESLEPRYATIALLFWGSILPLTFHVGFRLLPAAMRSWAGAPYVPLAVMLGVVAIFNVPGLYAREAQAFHSLLESQAEAMRENVFVPVLFRSTFYGSVAEASDRILFLRNHHLSVFAPGQADELAMPRSLQQPLPPCVGRIDLAYRLDASRFVVRAWLANAAARRTADAIGVELLGNEPAAIIPAVEARGAIRVDHVKVHNIRGIDTGLRDRVAGQDEAVSLRMFGLFRRVELRCEATQTLGLSPLRIQTVASIGGTRNLPAVVHQTEDTFGVDRPTIPTLSAPFMHETVYASGAAGDQEIGQITFALKPGPTDDIVVPFATGPDAAGQSIEVHFPDSIILTQPIPNDTAEGTWRALTIPHAELARHGGTVTIIAKDDGAQWGQWMAVATPVAATLDPDWAKLY